MRFQSEYVHCISRRSYSAEFKRMDVDGDDVLSYPETVAYVQQMGEIEAMKDYLIESLSGVIAAEFDFELTVDDDEDSLALFLEYVAVAGYFGVYDADVNGYVHRDEFVSISAQNEFAAYADEENGGITREAFFDILYGDDEYSWDGALHEMYGEHCEETVSAWAAVEISTDMVRDVDIKLNPMQLLRDADRAQQADPDAKASPFNRQNIGSRIIFAYKYRGKTARRLQGGMSDFPSFVDFCREYYGNPTCTGPAYK